MLKYLLRALLGLLVIAVLFIGYFLLVRKLDNALMEEQRDPVAVGTAPVRLPTLFRDGRFYIRVPVATGDTLLALCDTGGGLSMLMPSCVTDKGLQGYLHTGLMHGVMPVNYVVFDELCTDRSIPGPMPLRSFPLRHPFGLIDRPILMLPPADEARETEMMRATMGNDAFFGQDLFMGRSWTMDYLHEEVWVNTPITASGTDKPNVQPLGLQRNSAGDAVFGHGRMSISVEGGPIDVLFDTGASIVLSPEGQKAFKTSARSLAGSFIARSVFANWHRTHPEWPVYEHADLAGDVIEVPRVVIGLDTVGPVLFASRPDENWSQGMIHTMDSVVQGALGGSALRYFKVTVDYNSALIKFERQ